MRKPPQNEYHKKVDENQKIIVQALLKAGYTVVDLHAVGKSCPDILVGGNGKNILIEVKKPGEKLSVGQLIWHTQYWEGQCDVAHSPEEAINVAEVYCK